MNGTYTRCPYPPFINITPRFSYHNLCNSDANILVYLLLQKIFSQLTFVLMSKTSEAHIDQLLDSHELRKTSFRKEVLGIFISHQGNAITQHELEADLGQHDRITLYRTLKAFEQNGLVHMAVDSLGQSRYALCVHDHHHDHDHEDHTHFHCTQCGTTSCLDELPDPLQAMIPKGYEVHSYQVTFSGTCASCKSPQRDTSS